MSLSVYRVCRRLYARLDGEGAKRVGGRWNSPGRPVVYTSQSIALAVLENLVHMSREDYPSGYVIVKATIPDGVQILDIGEAQQRPELPDETKAAGDSWLATRESAVLRVPSFTIQGESNFLLNPLHPEFSQVIVALPTPFIFDERLFIKSDIAAE